MSNNPYETPTGFDSGGMGGGPDIQRMIAKVTPPAIALMVVGGLNVLFSLYGIGTSLLFMMGGNAAAAQQFDDVIAQGGEGAEMIESMAPYLQMMQGPLGLGLNVLALIVAAVIIMGALKMKKLESYGMALAAAILAMVPCLSNCCIIGLPIGIWALIVLMNADVKQSFR